MRFLIAVAALVACSGAWAEKVRLICEGMAPNYAAGGEIMPTSIEIGLDESANAVEMVDPNNKKEIGHDIVFGEGEITGKFKLGLLNVPRSFVLDRYTGSLTLTDITFDCRAKPTERKF